MGRRPEFPSVLKHRKDDSILTCYVDDFELQASIEKTPCHWDDIGKVIDFSEAHEVWGHDGEGTNLVANPEKGYSAFRLQIQS